MSVVQRVFERILIAVISLIILWLVVTQIFERLDQRMPAFLAGVATYIIAAYTLLPRFIQFSLMILRRGHVPRFTRTGDGLLADPVNIILIGSEEDLRGAFAAAGWYEAESLSLKTAWKMGWAFVKKKSYPTAPFSSLYLFGRRQDHGFQQPIGSSPRHRHHIRFWAANLDPEKDLTNFKYWLQKHSLSPSQPLMWAGSGSKDVGFGLTRHTYQISHKVDRNIDEERDHIVGVLRQTGWLSQENYFDSGKFIVGKYKSDGRMLTAYIGKPQQLTF